MTRALRPVVAAVSFLTLIPVPGAREVNATDVARSALFFPVVGALVGGFSGLLADVAVERLPALAAGALAVGAAALLTGALHLDALADTADAFGARDRDRALEIMRDHAVGAYGAVALIVVCVLDAALLGALATSGDAALVGLAAGAAGRTAMLLPALVLPYARSGDGLGGVLAGLGAASVATAALLAFVLALPAGWAGIGGAGAAGAIAVGCTFIAWRKFGGMTGDVLGATGKLAETSALLAAVVVLA